MPVAVLGPPAVRVAASGLAIAIPTGAALFMVQATEYVANPFLYVKFAAVLLGLANVAALRLAGDWTDERLARRGRWAGLVSLAAWLVALTAGRLIAYW